jgi:phospholipase C
MYSYSGTSHGAASNIAAKEISGYPQRTVFDDLYECGADFMVYFSDFPISLEMKNLRNYPDHFKFLYDDFFDDVKKGDLPAYTWLVCLFIRSIPLPSPPVLFLF